MKMFETKFSFAEKSILIKTNQKKINQMLNIFLPEFESKKKADLTIEYFFYEENHDLSFFVMGKKSIEIEKVFLQKNNKARFTSKKGKKNKMLVSGSFDLNKAYGRMELRMDRNFFWRFFVFNLAKCLVLYLTEKNANIIHCSALAKGNKAFIFPGKDNAGKSTVLRLCPETINLGEDLNFLFRKGKRFFVQSFPLVSLFTNTNKKTARSYELKAVIFLNKSKKLKIKKLNKIESIKKIFKNDAQAELNLPKTKVKERLFLYAEVFSAVPSFALFFPLRKNLWKKIEKKINK